MKRLSAVAFRSFQLGMLHCAARLTPVDRRREWLREWRAEHWHVRETVESSAQGMWTTERELNAFCLGAFQDALCLRRLSQQRGRVFTFRGSASQCILALCALLLICYGVSQLLPDVDAARHPSRYQIDPGLILIQNAEFSSGSQPTISAEKFRRWSERKQRYFNGFAYYRLANESLRGEENPPARVKVAHATSNLFALLGLHARFAEGLSDADSDTPKVFLSESVWSRKFGRDPDLTGKRVWIGNTELIVAGVVPAGDWRLPGNVDAWVLEPGSQTAGVGFVVAHLTELGKAEMVGARVHIVGYNTEDSDDELWGLSLHERMRGPWEMYLFTVFLAVLSLPAITSVSLAEYSFYSHKPGWGKRLVRWGFLCIKVALVLAIANFASLDLGYWHAANFSVLAEYVQLITSFLICLFGMRWVLLDQRQRCPVCLRRVTHPAQVGQASRLFLGWNGTELICTSGHTLLHVPGLPTSWFSTERWLYLDTSWEFLFAGTGVG